MTASARTPLVARALVAFTAVATILGAPLADLIIPMSAAQHLHNDAWPPHAKFHDAQYIVMSVLLGSMALALALRRGAGSRSRLVIACAILATPWLGLLAAPLFPGTAVQDPEFDNGLIIGLHPQVLLAIVLLALLLLAAAVAARTRHESQQGE